MKVTLLVAALLFGFPTGKQDDKIEELKKEIEKLKERVAALETERDRLAKDSLENAQEVIRLRQLLKHSTTGKSESDTPRKETKTEPKEEKQPSSSGDKKPALDNPIEVPDGPESPIRGKVNFVEKDKGFILIDVGEKEGVKVGYIFEIVTERKNEKGEAQLFRLAICRVEKFLGTTGVQYSKLKILEGKPSEIQAEDTAIAMRKTKGGAEKKDGGTAPRNGIDKVFKITGQTNDVFLLNYGRNDGGKQSDIVYVYRDRKLRAKLRLDTVEKDYSVARLIAGTETAAFGEGDEISLQEVKPVLCGRVKKVDSKTGIWLEIGTNDGVKVGMRFKVQRLGKDVGEITIKEAKPFWSIAQVSGETKPDDIQERDYVEEKQ